MSTQNDNRVTLDPTAMLDRAALRMSSQKFRNYRKRVMENLNTEIPYILGKIRGEIRSKAWTYTVLSEKPISECASYLHLRFGDYQLTGSDFGVSGDQWKAWLSQTAADLKTEISNGEYA